MKTRKNVGGVRIIALKNELGSKRRVGENYMYGAIGCRNGRYTRITGLEVAVRVRCAREGERGCWLLDEGFNPYILPSAFRTRLRGSARRAKPCRAAGRGGCGPVELIIIMSAGKIQPYIARQLA